MSNSTDTEIKLKAEQFSERFSEDISPLFPAQLLSVRASFQDMFTVMKDIKELAHLLVIDNASLASSYPDVCTACFMYLTVPVTVATAERSFSKLKLIKNYLRSSMAQERLSALALSAIEIERAQNISF